MCYQGIRTRWALPNSLELREAAPWAPVPRSLREAALGLKQRLPHSTATRQATQAPTLRAPAGSVADPAPRSGREPRGPMGRDGLRTGQVSWCSHGTPWHRPPHRPGPVPPGTARHTVPAQYLRSGQVCPAGRAGVRSACTVPHTVPVSFREAHVGRCVLPGGQVCGAAQVRCR